MDTGRFYALLRFEEASLALRTVMHMGLVDHMEDRQHPRDQLREALGFTKQAARTFFALLEVMAVLERAGDQYRVTPLAAHCLADGVSTSRKPYLSMGTQDDVEAFIGLLKGRHPDEALPLYSGENDGRTVMDETEVAREIAFGLASRARNFAEPLAGAVAAQARAANSLADIGAGSPYVAQACLQALPNLQKVMLVDRANAMRFAREMIDSEFSEAARLEFHEADFFTSVPAADVFILSNTAHDWKPPEYSAIADNIRRVIPKNGLVCIHEPILSTSWNSDSEWLHALWMACYAQTLFRITLGEGTCYTMEEHHTILANSGFQPSGGPVPTSDGCTALFYSVMD